MCVCGFTYTSDVLCISFNSSDPLDNNLACETLLSYKKTLYNNVHCKNYIVKITNLLVSTVARNSINFNVVGHTGDCGYMHDVAMTVCTLE